MRVGWRRRQDASDFQSGDRRSIGGHVARGEARSLAWLANVSAQLGEKSSGVGPLLKWYVLFADLQLLVNGLIYRSCRLT